MHTACTGASAFQPELVADCSDSSNFQHKKFAKKTASRPAVSQSWPDSGNPLLPSAIATLMSKGCSPPVLIW